MDKNRTNHIYDHFKYNTSDAARQKTWRDAIDAARNEPSKSSQTQWQLGGIAMLRSMKATLQLLREGKWTLEQAEQWVEEQLK